MPQPRFPHIEYANLVCGAIAVFYGAQNAVRHLAVALEVQHGVHNVLQHLWTRDGAVFVDVTDENRRNIERLGAAHDRVRAFAHLCDAAGRRIEIGKVHRLDGVDHYDIRFFGANVLHHELHVRFRQNAQVGTGNTETPCAQLDLPCRFFAGNI